MLNQRKEILTDFRFKVEIDSLMIAGFSDVSGLQSEIEVETHVEGGNDYVHQLPKGVKYTNLTLKRGITDSDILWKWYKENNDAVLYRKGLKKRDISVIILNELGDESHRFFFKNAYPIKWIGSDLKGSGSGIAIETLEFVHQGFERS